MAHGVQSLQNPSEASRSLPGSNLSESDTITVPHSEFNDSITLQTHPQRWSDSEETLLLQRIQAYKLRTGQNRVPEAYWVSLREQDFYGRSLASIRVKYGELSKSYMQTRSRRKNKKAKPPRSLIICLKMAPSRLAAVSSSNKATSYQTDSSPGSSHGPRLHAAPGPGTSNSHAVGSQNIPNRSNLVATPPSSAANPPGAPPAPMSEIQAQTEESLNPQASYDDTTAETTATDAGVPSLSASEHLEPKFEKLCELEDNEKRSRVTVNTLKEQLEEKSQRFLAGYDQETAARQSNIEQLDAEAETIREQIAKLDQWNKHCQLGRKRTQQEADSLNQNSGESSGGPTTKRAMVNRQD